MKAIISVKKEVEIKTLEVFAAPRYWEDTQVNGVYDSEEGELIPCKQTIKEEQLWCPIIDIELGVITNWPNGIEASIHYKVVDQGSYVLKDEKGEIVAKIENDYVPTIMDPTGDGYGDYVIFDVDENGKISPWNNNPTLKDFYIEN